MMLAFLLTLSTQGLTQSILGNFNIYEDEDGKDIIYFKVTNNTGFPIYNMSLVLKNERKNQSIQLSHNSVWFTNTYNEDYSLIVGPNYGWNWEKGEKAYVYINGRNYGYWVCDISIPTLFEKILENKPRGRMPKGWTKEVGKVLKRIK